MKKWTYLLLTALLISSAACNKKKEQEAVSDLNRVVKTPTLPPQRIVHKLLTIKKYETIKFEVPPHCRNPRLHGNYESFRYRDDGGRSSDEIADIDLLLLDEQQYDDFTRGPSDSVTRSVQEAFRQEVDWALPSTSVEARIYYLVFSNSTGTPKTKLVDADFTLSFE
jgi:hypothetical protein